MKMMLKKPEHGSTKTPALHFGGPGGTRTHQPFASKASTLPVELQDLSKFANKQYHHHVALLPEGPYS